MKKTKNQNYKFKNKSTENFDEKDTLEENIKNIKKEYNSIGNQTKIQSTENDLPNNLAINKNILLFEKDTNLINEK